jgi:hypothetical protein
MAQFSPHDVVHVPMSWHSTPQSSSQTMPQLTI